FNSLAAPIRRLKLDRTVAPMRIHRHMAVRRMVPTELSVSAFQPNLRKNSARMQAPKAPMAPASVGVAIPVRMVPSTQKIKEKASRPLRTASALSFQVPSSLTDKGG